MNSDTARAPKRGGGNILVTPSIALLHQKLGTSPAPRMLMRSEIDLLRASKREMIQAVDEAFATRDGASSY